MADRRADPGQLARRNGGADTGAAHEHRALCVAALNRLADLARLVGIVDANRIGVRAEVDHLVIRQDFEHRVTQVDAAVVERHRDLHRTSTLAMRPSSNVNRSGSVRPSACTIATACPSFRTSIPSRCTDGSSPSMHEPRRHDATETSSRPPPPSRDTLQQRRRPRNHVVQVVAELLEDRRPRRGRAEVLDRDRAATIADPLRPAE